MISKLGWNCFSALLFKRLASSVKICFSLYTVTIFTDGWNLYFNEYVQMFQVSCIFLKCQAFVDFFLKSMYHYHHAIIVMLLIYISVYVEFEMKFVEHKINHFKVNIFVVLCNHHFCLVPKHFHQPTVNLIAIKQFLFPRPLLLATTDLHSVSVLNNSWK